MIPSDYLITKYNQAIPRYTSYPPANFFSKQTGETYKQHIIASNNEEPNNISVYIHIPFCAQLCWYCGCNTSVCNTKSVIDNYLDFLHIEISQVIELLDKTRKISQIHFGGGTPSILLPTQIKKIVEAFSSKFEYTKDAEIAIECNPANLDENYIIELKKIGFTRISMGIQDFDHKILKAVNRELPNMPIEKLTEIIHSNGLKVNYDFIYGLPFQTKESFATNIHKAIEFGPDRLVTFSYAHLPSIKPHQSLLQSKPMAGANEKLQMLDSTYTLLTEAGYTAIGLDHFAKADDELSLALKSKKLHRNFQGYCTRKSTGQVYAFGASGISQLSGSFFQNYRSSEEYIENIQTKGWAVQAGHILTLKEKITAAIIESILCNEILNWNEIALRFNVSSSDLKNDYSFNSNQIKELIDDNLIKAVDYGYEVTTTGKYFLRNIAASFDPEIKLTTKTFSSSI